MFLGWIKSLVKPAWAPFLLFVIDVIAFNHQVYEKYPLVDIPMHLLGGFAMDYFLDYAFVGACILSGVSFGGLMRAILVFTSTSTVAVFWEFGEFVLGWVFSINLQAGLADTMKDLFFGMAGSLFYIAAVFTLKQKAVRHRSSRLNSLEFDPAQEE